MENQAPSTGGLLRGQAAYEPRTPWTPGLALLTAVLIVLVSVAGAALLFGLGKVGIGNWRGASDEAATMLVLAAGQLVTVLLTLVAAALFGGRLVDVLALRAPAGGVGVYLGAVVLMVLLQVAVGVLQHVTIAHDMFADLRPFVRLATGPEWPLALLVVGVGAPLSEELLVRGFLLSALARSRLGFAAAAVISTALWAALHAGYTLVGILEVFIIGLFFSWLVWRTGSVRVAIFCHALYNSLILLALRFVPLPA